MMNRDEIIKIVSANDTTVLSFPNRGPWGSSYYRGNCSGYIPAFFIWKYDAASVAEIFAGSGTTSDLCKDMGIPYKGIDLNPEPARKDIITMNILDDQVELPDEFYSADLCFLHPPYPGINNVRYSTGMWHGTAEEIAQDIQEMDWKRGMQAVNHAIMRGYNAMPAGSFEVVLVGDVRSKGQYHSMIADLIRPTELHQLFVKVQHNCVSDRSGNTYNRSARALTAHEMIAVFKKPSGYEIAYVVPHEYKLDVRDSSMATWKDLVAAVMRKLGKESSLDEIYKEIEGHKKAESNPHWREKVRQTLQSGPFSHTGRGKWSFAA